ncbi:MAG: HD domain-containing protein [Chloroflexi bacterium]|nr:HD domain-containing protein [Chloroflexota bacterium]
MLDLQRIAIENLVEEVKQGYIRTYSNMQPEYGNIIAWSARLALENIANTDALYHNVEHTIMVTLAGQAILEGKHLYEGRVSPKEWLHFMMAALCHDIGYVAGVCQKDNGRTFATGIGEKTVTIADGLTDVSLTPYHVDRGKQFVRERFSETLVGTDSDNIDAELIATYIEFTRFPPPDKPEYKDTRGYGGLLRAADFIGQLGDPDYLRKIPALYYEFEELGTNKEFGYSSPGELRVGFAKFYWNVVSPYIKDALRYLQVTQVGKQWIANLYSHVFASEHATTD